MNNGYELGWDDAIQNDGPEYITLPEGDYDFTVTEVERARHAGSDKLPPCNKAIAYLKIETPEGTTTIKHNLFLHSSVEGLLCAFFTAIGQRKKGERLQMNWNMVVGSSGRARINIRKWRGDDSEERTSNQVKRFYEPDDSQPKKFQAGKF